MQETALQNLQYDLNKRVSTKETGPNYVKQAGSSPSFAVAWTRRVRGFAASAAEVRESLLSHVLLTRPR